MDKFWKWCKETITRQDIFGQKITFTYDGQDSFRSFYSGFVSLAIQLAIFVNFVVFIEMLSNYGDTKIGTK